MDIFMTRASISQLCRLLPVATTAMVFSFFCSAIVIADPMVSPFIAQSEESVYPDNALTDPPVIAAANDDPMDRLMQSIVTINATTSDIARTAANFGIERQGSGVVLDANGLIVTAGYTIAEATSVTVTFSNGVTEQAKIVAFDEATGLGLVRTPVGITTTPIKLGKSAGLKSAQKLMIIPATGEADAKGVKVGKIKKFTGGWEYIINDAIHTYPPSTSFTGAALVSDNAELVGIGALVTIDIDIDPKIRIPGNIFVPVDSLTGVLGELIVSGRSNASMKPWLGVDTKQTKQGIVVRSVVEDGPAQKSGLKAGDVIVAVDQAKVSSQTQMYEKIWSIYKPGDQVHLLVVRNDQFANVSVTSMDYYDWLRMEQGSDTVITEMVE